MGGAASEAPVPPDRLLVAIERAGLLGITAKQIAAVADLAEADVVARLGALASSQTIARVGRGLWVLKRFESVPSTPGAFKGPAWYDEAFQREFRLRFGHYAGATQFNPNEQLPVHRWWPYVQGFSAGFVESVCRTQGVGRGSVVLDPFCGSGTVPVVARRLGAQGIGIDMMPITAWVARAKGEWEVEPSTLRAAAEAVLARRTGPRSSPPFLRETLAHFHPKVLEGMLRLKASVWARSPGRVRTLLQLAFASILVDASNLKRAPCLGYATKTGLGPETPFELFRAATQRIEEDLRILRTQRATWGPRLRIHEGPSGTVRIPPGSVDLAITSPPYVNGMDYVTNYKLDLAWMDLVRSYAELRALRAAMVACDNVPRTAVVDARPVAEVREDPWVGEVVAGIDANIATKAAYRREDMSGVVSKYFNDLLPTLRNVHRSLRPGGRLVVVNGDSFIAGTYVPGDLIFARLAARVGFQVEAFEHARTRRSGQRRGFLLRESVTTLRKDGGEVSAPSRGPMDPQRQPK